MDERLNDPLADELADLLDLIRIDDITDDSQATKWAKNRGYDSVKFALASILTALPKGTKVCLK